MDILEARELRKKHIVSLYQTYNETVVSIKGNIKGPLKNPSFMMGILTYFYNSIKEQYQSKILYKEHYHSIDGDTFILIIKENPIKIKEYTISLETSEIGRLIDCDVYHNETLSRSVPRTCLICDKDSFLCIRSQAHTTEEVLQKTKEIVREFYTKKLLEWTKTAIVREVSLHPKFGLVTKESSGSHKDMNYYTFMKSKDAIEEGLREYIKEGFNEQLDINELIQIGKNTEQAMFQATRNINTHKGLIFLLGLLLPNITKMLYYGDQNIQSNIQKLSEQVIKDYYDTIIHKRVLSHSDIIYLKYGVKGIRDEALNGLPLLFKKKNRHHDLDYLIFYMSELNDTTIIHKTDLETLKQVHKDMKSLLQKGGYLNNELEVYKLTKQYMKKNISPGGSADYLVCQFIYDEVQSQFKTEDFN